MAHKNQKNHLHQAQFFINFSKDIYIIYLSFIFDVIFIVVAVVIFIDNFYFMEQLDLEAFAFMEHLVAFSFMVHLVAFSFMVHPVAFSFISIIKIMLKILVLVHFLITFHFS